MWNDIALARGVRRYVPGVQLTHLHPANRTALRDGIHRKRRKRQDYAIYSAWKKTQ